MSVGSPSVVCAQGTYVVWDDARGCLDPCIEESIPTSGPFFVVAPMVVEHLALTRGPQELGRIPYDLCSPSEPEQQAEEVPHEGREGREGRVHEVQEVHSRGLPSYLRRVELPQRLQRVNR